ncbi:DUF2200 domain-containing protein [Companilactobacillus versmoldensis]|nr:DUF2200 domain-containing protein [Companilactobacillus versmoldensis]
MANQKIFQMEFREIYSAYLKKVERKGHSKQELDQVILWFTGHDQESLQQCLNTPITMEEFYQQVPMMNPNAPLITGVICGIRVEEISDPLMQKIRYLDKLVDEVAKGKKMENILRH